MVHCQTVRAHAVTGVFAFCLAMLAAFSNVAAQSLPITEFPLPNSGSDPTAIVAGPDGNLWFTEAFAGNRIGRITPDGVLTEFTVPTAGSQPLGITAGPDGNLWFTEIWGNQIGRITPAGVITEFPLTPGTGPYGITTGPDGNIWFTRAGGNGIGRITQSGVATEFAGEDPGTPRGITAGADGNLWFAAEGGAIGRVAPSGTIINLYPARADLPAPCGV